MTRVLSATFLLFYTAFTVVAVSEHTASAASSYARNGSSQSQSIRAASPRSSQVRIQEESFAGFSITAAIALADTGLTASGPSSIGFIGDSRHFTFSRAPPALL
jgi:hypothetical protein